MEKSGIFLFVAFLSFPIPFFIFAQESSDLSSLISQLQSQIQALQTRINELETELGVKSQTTAMAKDDDDDTEIDAPSPSISLPSFTQALSLGSRGDDVRNLQTFLAHPPTGGPDIYPEGLITGYYGPLTEKAIQRFQAKHNIVSAGAHDTTGYGRLGPRTLARVNELLKEGVGASGKIPPGLLTAPGIQKKFATTTPSGYATTTPSDTIPAIPAQPIGQTGTTTVPATPAIPTQTSGGTPPPPPSATPPPPPTPPPPAPPPSTATTTPPTMPPPSPGDIIGPSITKPQATNITTSAATITWTINESADGTVEYGLTSSYGSAIATSTFTVPSGYYAVTSVTVSGLQPNTAYHYRVKSKDTAGNTATSGDYTFTTLAPSSPPPSSLEFKKLDADSPFVAKGSMGSFLINTYLVANYAVFDHTAIFSVSGLPSSTTISFGQTYCTSGEPCLTPMTITVGSSASVGAYSITITANAENLTKSTTVLLTITEESPTPSITVISPNGGEQWKTGETHIVTWTSRYLPCTNRLAVYLIGSPTSGYPGIAYNLPSTTNSVSWTISNNIFGNNIKVQVDCDNLESSPPWIAYDRSDAPFTVTTSSASTAQIDTLAFLLQSLATTLDEIERQVQKLLK